MKLIAATLAFALGPLAFLPALAEEEPDPPAAASAEAPETTDPNLESPAAEATPAASGSLYERLGGLRGITILVNDFHDRLETDPIIGMNPAVTLGRKHSPPAYLKFQISQLVCSLSGGPCTYGGLKMKEAHAHLRISAEEWEAMREDLKSAMDKEELSAALQDEILALFGQVRADIVTPAGMAAGER